MLMDQGIAYQVLAYKMARIARLAGGQNQRWGQHHRAGQDHHRDAWDRQTGVSDGAAELRGGLEERRNEYAGGRQTHCYDMCNTDQPVRDRGYDHKTHLTAVQSIVVPVITGLLGAAIGRVTTELKVKKSE